MSQLPSDATQQNQATIPDPTSAASAIRDSNSFGMNLQRTLAICRNAFREAVRDRVLYNLVLFVLLLIGGSVFLGELSAGQESKIIVDLGLWAMHIFVT